MKKKFTLTLIVMAIMIFALAIVSSAAVYYVDDEGNVSTEPTEDTVYHFEPGGDRNSGTSKCFRVGTIYLHDTSTTKIVFPVASEVKSGYTGIAPQSGWAHSLYVYGVDADGNVITETVTNEDGTTEEVNVSYATQISEIEFLSGVDIDGANNPDRGAFNGFSSLKTLTFHGDVVCQKDATNKGGFFQGTQITEVNFYGSGNINLQILRHINSNNELTVTFHEGCSATVTIYEFQYTLPYKTLNNWTIIVNPELTYISTLTDDEGNQVNALYKENVTGLNLIMATQDKNAYEGTDLTTSHNLLYTKTSEAPIVATVKTYCEIYGKHGTFIEVNSCVAQCKKCSEYNALENPEHVLVENLYYNGGYTAEGESIISCTNDGCKHSVTTTISALFTSKGYSKDTNSNAIVLDIKVDNEAVAAYETYLKNNDENATILYGVVVAIDATENKPLNDDATAKAGALAIKFNENNYTNIQIKITGIDEANYETGIYCSGYMYANNEVTYINGATTSDVAEKVTYASLPSDEE